MQIAYTIETFQSIIPDAVERLTAIDRDIFQNPDWRTNLHSMSHYRWPQSWPNTACGFGGISGQAFTQAPCDVFESQFTGACVVYHAGRFAYSVRNPGERFLELMQRWNLPGAKDAKVIALLEREEPANATETD